MKWLIMALVIAIWLSGIFVGIPLTDSPHLPTKIGGFFVFVGCIAGGIWVITVADKVYAILDKHGTD